MKAIFLGLLVLLALTQVKAEEQFRQEGNFTIEDLIETLRGVLESWEVGKEEVSKLLLCVGGLKDIESQVYKIMEEIKKINVGNIMKLVEAVVRLFGTFQQIFKDIEPCIDSEGEVRKLTDKFINVTSVEFLTKVLLNIMDNARRIYNDILGMIAAFRKEDYYTFGYDVGDIIEALFFKKPNPVSN